MSPDLFLKLSVLGLSHEQMAGVIDVVKCIEAEHIAQVEKSREKARARLQKWRDKQPKNVSKRFTTSPDVSKRLTCVEDSSSKEEISEKENKRGRATRLPKDWTLPFPWLDEAVAAGLPASRVHAEADRMRNWSLSDRNGAKHDWHATWRNWFQRAIEALTKTTGPPKKVTLASMWRDEGRKAGILPNEPTHEIDRRLGSGFGDGSAPGPNLARRIASAGSG